MLSLSSAAFCLENFAGTVSVFSGAPGTAKAPLTNTELSAGLALGACELGSSLPILPDGVCCAFSCCSCCCGSAAGRCCCCATALPALNAVPPSSARTREPVRTRSRGILVSFFIRHFVRRWGSGRRSLATGPVARVRNQRDHRLVACRPQRGVASSLAFKSPHPIRREPGCVFELHPPL